MLISSYDPYGQGTCLTCKKVSPVIVRGGLLAYGWGPRYMEYECRVCGSVNTIYVDGERPNRVVPKATEQTPPTAP